MGNRALLYARVAAGGGESGARKLARQLELCREHAQRRGWRIVAELAEVGGVSGATLDRPQLHRARRMAQAGEFDVLVVLGNDRLSRRVADLLVLKAELARVGVQVECVESDDSAIPPQDLNRLMVMVMMVGCMQPVSMVRTRRAHIKPKAARQMKQRHPLARQPAVA